MIELVDVAKEYHINNHKIRAVDEVSLSIQSNEIFGIVGESGAGKSTLLRFINLLEKPTTGSVLIDGEDLTASSKEALRLKRKKISIVFQQFNLLNNKTVAENILLPLSLHAYEDSLSLESVLKFVGLENQRHQYPSQLSGGQKQRVGIARALITKPEILLCDEPTSALDMVMTSEVVNLLRAAHQKFNMTIVVVTHELDVVQQLCQRVALIEAGRLVDIVDNHSAQAKSFEGTYHDKVLEVLA